MGGGDLGSALSALSWNQKLVSGDREPGSSIRNVIKIAQLVFSEDIVAHRHCKREGGIILQGDESAQGYSDHLCCDTEKLAMSILRQHFEVKQFEAQRWKLGDDGLSEWYRSD